MAPEHSLFRKDFQGLIAMTNPIFFNRMIVTVTVLTLVSLAAADDDRQPMEVLREGVSQGLAFLDDQTYRGVDGRAAQEAHIRELTMTLFDFTTMSRMVLSSYWGDFTTAQQTAFVHAFRAFLQRTYLPILLDRYNGEQIEYVRQIRLSNSRARVEVRVLHRGRAIPVDVKMIRRIGRWRVYDVDALGFSAVAIYRAQFKWLLGRETPAQVIERLLRSQGHPP
jgi:phospholipid transport system substrate-binding protein